MEGSARKRPTWAVVMAAAMCTTWVIAAVASAHAILSGPTISGVPQEGRTLTAKAEWSGTVTATIWKWQRCTAGASQMCTVITGATQPTYVLGAKDVGFVIRVRLTLTAPDGNETSRSKATSVVQPAPAPPPPVETEEPAPEEPSEDPVDPASFDPPANPVVAPLPEAAAGLRVMNPFPVVRISGHMTESGAHITRLAVRAPRGATVTVRCRGRSCPVRRFAHAASVARLRTFERHLRAGTRLDIVVRKPERIGKWATITIRRAALPRRVDRCSYPGRGEPAACPPT
jgi:hypothetical protein